MVAAVREPAVHKRFWSDTFAPPASYRAAATLTGEVTVAEILEGGVRESDWSFPVVISTASEDHVGDCVIPEGCRLRSFAANPIIVFDHQQIRFPVGILRSPHDKRLYFAIEPGKAILGRVWIRQPDENDHTQHADICRTAWYLVRDGFLNGLSVGFDPLGQAILLPSGGKLYEEWELLEISLVAVPANRECLVIRNYADSMARIGKRLLPSVIKSLTESSGTGGGYTVAEETKSSEGGQNPAGTAVESGKTTLKAICSHMGDHAEHNKGHQLHYNEETGDLEHWHPGDATPEHVKAIGDDLGSTAGIKSFSQHVIPSENAPEIKAGYGKIWPAEEKSRYQEGGGVDAGSLPARTKGLRGRRAAIHVERGQHLMHMCVKGMLNWRVHKSLEECVHHKIPKLIEEGYEQEQAIAIAFSMCGEKKGLLPPITKSFAAAVSKAYDESYVAKAVGTDADSPEAQEAFAENYDANPIEPEAAGVAPGLALAQGVIDMIESDLDRQEPERRGFWEHVIDEVRDHGEETYPGEDFGGADDAALEASNGRQLTTSQAAQAKEPGEQAENYDMLARYKHHRPGQRKGYQPAKAKGKHSPFGEDHKDMIRSAANHCHDVGDMEAVETNKGCHLKGYTPAHHRKMRIVARSLDRIHGAITKGEEVAGQEGDAKETASGRKGKKEVEKSAVSAEVQELREELRQRGQTLAALGIRAGLKVPENDITAGNNTV